MLSQEHGWRYVGEKEQAREQERRERNVPLADSGGAEGATVGAGDGALALGKGLVLEGAQGGDAVELLAGVAADGDGATLAEELHGEAATGGAHNTALVRHGVVRLAAKEGDTLNHLWDRRQKAKAQATEYGER